MIPHWTWTHAKVAVTGARGGLGQALCQKLREEGAQVHGISRGIAWNPGDYDCIILNAGFSLVQSSKDPLEAQAEELLSVNLWQPITQAHSALSQGAWHVHLVGSTSSILASAQMALYAATKYGLRGWAYGAMRELPGRVSISYPAGIQTNFLANMRGTPDTLQAFKQRIEHAYHTYDRPEVIAGNILEGIRWGAREIIPSVATLQWFLSIEHDMQRMWFPGLQQPSPTWWDWWEETRQHYECCPWQTP